MKYLLLLALLVACKSKNPTEPAVTAKVSSVATASSNSETSSTSEITNAFKSGIFKSTDVSTTGSWSIEERKDGFYLVLGADFKSTTGPDLFLVISKRPNTDFTSTNFSSIPEGDRLILGDIFQGTYASQERKISLSLEELNEYKTILFQCVRYSHTFGIAEIP